MLRREADSGRCLASGKRASNRSKEAPFMRTKAIDELPDSQARFLTMPRECGGGELLKTELAMRRLGEFPESDLFRNDHVVAGFLPCIRGLISVRPAKTSGCLPGRRFLHLRSRSSSTHPRRPFPNSVAGWRNGTFPPRPKRCWSTGAIFATRFALTSLAA